MIDPLVTAAGVGFVGAVAGGPAVAYGIDRVPQERRRIIAWGVILAALLAAVLSDFVFKSAAGHLFVYVLAAIPGVLTFVVSRSLLATAFVALLPFYLVIGEMTRGKPVNVPEIALDRAMGLRPGWMLVYGSLYAFAWFMPLLVVRDWRLGRRALQAYLVAMVVAYAGFLIYPTVGPRPDVVPGDGFAAWSLRFMYDIDPPHGCFPSLHVAYSFLAALVCWRLNRGLGVVCWIWAALVAVSTVYTKQHYVVDTIAGAILGYAVYWIFVRGYPRAAVSDEDRTAAPRRALIAVALYAATIGGFWVAWLGFV